MRGGDRPDSIDRFADLKMLGRHAGAQFCSTKRSTRCKDAGGEHIAVDLAIITDRKNGITVT